MKTVFLFCAVFFSSLGYAQIGAFLAADWYNWGEHPNAVIVLDAARDVGTVGSSAFGWSDQAAGAYFGNAASQVLPYVRRGHNGQPYMDNNNTKPRHCTNCYYSIDTTSTIVVVIDWKGQSAGSTFEYLMDAWPDRGAYVVMEADGADTLRMRGVNGGAITDGYYYWRADISGTSSTSYIYENGALKASGTANGDTTFGGSTGGTGERLPGVAVLGFNAYDSFANVTGDLYFYAIFSPALNAADIARLDNYINNRFGL